MEHLRIVRDATGLTRAKLSRLSGVASWRIAAHELEHQELRQEEFAALRRVLGPEIVKLARSLREFQTQQ
jgi:hypothetical protein